MLVEGLGRIAGAGAQVPNAGRFYLKAGEGWIVKFYQDSGKAGQGGSMGGKIPPDRPRSAAKLTVLHRESRAPGKQRVSTRHSSSSNPPKKLAVSRVFSQRMPEYVAGE